MIDSMPNRMAAKRRGRPSFFADLPAQPNDPPPPSDEALVIQYGQRCLCGKPPTWLRVVESTKGDGIVIRQCVCRGCGRNVAVRCLK